MNRVLVVLATRGRPEALARMLESVASTAPDVKVAVYFDEDDSTRHQPLPYFVLPLVGPRVGPVASLNVLVSSFPDYQVYAAATDDCVFDVPGWSGWLLHNANYLCLMCPHVPGADRPMNFPCATRSWIDAVGYFAYPRLHHFYWDVILEILGDESQLMVEATKREFVIHHDKHPSSNLEQHLGKDATQFAIWCAYHRKPTLKRLKEAFRV